VQRDSLRTHDLGADDEDRPLEAFESHARDARLGLSSEFVSPDCIQCETHWGVFPTRHDSTVHGLRWCFGFRGSEEAAHPGGPSQAGETDVVFAAYVAGSRSG